MRKLLLVVLTGAACGVGTSPSKQCGINTGGATCIADDGGTVPTIAAMDRTNRCQIQTGPLAGHCGGCTGNGQFPYWCTVDPTGCSLQGGVDGGCNCQGGFCCCSSMNPP